MGIDGLSRQTVSIVDETHDQCTIVARASQGDELAFREIVDQYGALLLGTAALIIGDHHLAEDAVQDALILAWKHIGDLRQVDALRSWLLRILVNQCLRLKRRLIRTRAYLQQALLEQELNLLAQTADDSKGRQEHNWDLAHAVATLPMKQQVVIILHYYNGMTLPEMAQVLQESENTLKKRIQAALIKLRNQLRFDEVY